MKSWFIFVIVLLVGCMPPKKDQTQTKLPEKQAHQDQSLPEGKKIGPLTQKEWAENWDIWYANLVRSIQNPFCCLI